MNDAELVPEDVTVDSVVETVVIELVTLPVELVILPVELDIDPVLLEVTVALVVVPETEAADEEAVVVESIANWPE